MAAPVNIKSAAAAGNSSTGNSGSPVLHGIGAQSNVLQTLHILAQNNSTSSVPSVSAVASDNGLVWHLLSRTTNTVDNAFSPGPVNDTTQVLEIWWTYGAVTNGGTWSFLLDRSVDGWNAHYQAWTGAVAANPFDLNALALLHAENQADSDITVTATTDTSNVMLVGFFGRSANNNAGSPRMSAGALSDSSEAGNFSATNNMRSQVGWKPFTTGVTGVSVGYSSALGNGPVTNYSGIVYAITADVQSTGSTGTLAVVEAPDTFAGAGSPTINAALAATEAADTAVFTGPGKYYVRRITGGDFHGSGAKPASGAFDDTKLTTYVNDEKIMIVIFSSRANTGPDFHRTTSIDGTSLTWSHIVNEDFTYTLPSGSFPVVSYHCDVFIANVPTPITNQSFSSTMTGNDTFVNDGWFSTFSIRGLGSSPIDANASNLDSSSNMTGVASAVSLSGINTDTASPLIFWLAWAKNPSGNMTVPSGFAEGTVPTTGDSHFPVGNSGETSSDVAAVFKEYSTQQSSLTLASGTSSHTYWWAMPIVLAADAAGITATMSPTEAKDTFAGTGSTTITAALAATEAKDTFSGFGTITDTGTLAATEAKDTLAFIGETSSPVTGTLGATEAKDVFAATGYQPITGTLGATEAKDTLAFSGGGVVAALAATEAKDTFAAAGWAGPISAALAATEAKDIAAFTTETPIEAVVAATEHADHCRILGEDVVIKRRRILIVS